MDLNKTLPILELYSACQAEGSRAGYPTIVVRTTGCTHRCFFGDGGWCDSWYTSIHPERGKYTFQHIIDIYEQNPHIKEMMLTGGSPTMHMELVNDLNNFCYDNNIFLTIETEGSFAINVDKPINLISFSPKFSNSIPVIGTKTPIGQLVDEKFIKQHNKFRKNISAIASSILKNNDFHLKPVIDKNLEIFPEVEQFLEDLAQELANQEKIMLGDVPNIEWHLENMVKDWLDTLKSKTWLMPAGDNRESLMESYGPVINLAKDKGYKFTGRPHIIAFDKERLV